MSKKFYAVRKGRASGVFTDWASCSEQVHKYTGALYKSFDTIEEAQKYLEQPDILKSTKYESTSEILETLGDGEMVAYVDGSNLGDGTAFSWGVVTFSKEMRKRCLSGRSEDERFIRYRNVSGELFAAVNAVNFALQNGIEKVIIYHDYSGIRHWALGEWKTKNDLSKHYKRYFDKIKGEIEVVFIKADGHTGDKYNEEADILAKRALGIR